MTLVTDEDMLIQSHFQDVGYVYLAAPEINDKENVVFVTLRIVGPKHEKTRMLAGKNTANK